MIYIMNVSLQCSDTVGWAMGRASKSLKKTGCWFVDGDNLAGALHILIALVVTTNSIILFSKIKNGDILVPANPGPPDKLLLKQREREVLLLSTQKLQTCSPAYAECGDIITAVNNSNQRAQIKTRQLIISNCY